jgi:hypothetical protein
MVQPVAPIARQDYLVKEAILIQFKHDFIIEWSGQANGIGIRIRQFGCQTIGRGPTLEPISRIVSERHKRAPIKRVDGADVLLLIIEYVRDIAASSPSQGF